MTVHIDSSDLEWIFPVLIGTLIAFVLLCGLIKIVVGAKEDAKELVTKKVKVLEKPIQQGNVEWYIVECENGERLKLRNLEANTIIITVGDEGVISFKGKTVYTFQRS